MVYATSIHTDLGSSAEVLMFYLMFSQAHLCPRYYLRSPELHTCLTPQSDTVS